MRPGHAEQCWPRRTGKRATFWWRDSSGKRHHALASRVALALHTGAEVPPGLAVAHSCDNPPCCNPAHISAKTQQENTVEAITRGLRTYDTPAYLETREGWWRHGRNGPGESNANAKLTDADVRAVKAALAEGQRQTDVAKAFGVGQSTISRIARGATRKDI